MKSQQSLKLRILDYVFLRFFEMPLQKNVKSRVFFWIFKTMIIDRFILMLLLACCQQFYPVNYLRNVALGQANTEHVFLLDVDFLPMLSLYDFSRQLLASASTVADMLDITTHNKLVRVICARVVFLLTSSPVRG